MTFELPIRARLTLLYTAVLAAIVVGLGSFLVVRLHADLVSGVDARLALASNEISIDFTTAAESEFRDITDRSMAGLDRSHSAAQVLSARGAVVDFAGLAGPSRPLVGPDVLQRVLRGEPVVQTGGLGLNQGDFRLRAAPFPNGRVLALATSLAETDRSVHRLWILLLTWGPASLLLCAAGGWLMARRALLPVATMTDEANRIGARDLDRRIRVPAVRDELHRLAVTLNLMLGRLQDAVEQQRRFSADASHELRTPLAVMRTELQVALSAPDLQPEARETLESALEEVTRMTQLADDLLTLARMDAGRLEATGEPLRLGDVAERAAAVMAPLAVRHDVGVHLELRGPGSAEEVVLGAPERLTEVVTNFLENAIKHSSPGSVVELEAWQRDGEAGVTVRDRGPGIPPEALPHVFERFYRADRSRSSPAGGSGLGLAISREIVLAHGGRIWAESELGQGSAFSFALPVHRHVGPRG